MIPFISNSTKGKTEVKERRSVVAQDQSLGEGSTAKGQEGTLWRPSISVVVMELRHLYTTAQKIRKIFELSCLSLYVYSALK